MPAVVQRPNQSGRTQPARKGERRRECTSRDWFHGKFMGCGRVKDSDNRQGGSVGHSSRRQIELRAYQLSENRGRPWGTHEVDWFRAERELMDANRDHWFAEWHSQL